jgi:hypothetical protein
MKLLILAFNVIGFWLMADPAHADPITGLIAAAIAKGGLGALIVKFVVGAVLSFGMSLLQKALQKKPKQEAIGVNVEIQMGDDVSATVLLGTYATAGRRKYTGTWGEPRQTPNAFLVDVIELSNMPSNAGPLGLTSMWIDDKKCGVRWDQPHPDGRGYPVVEYRGTDGDDHLWVKYLDGTQTAGDPYLMAKFGADPDRPFLPSMIGRGCQVVILTALYNADYFSGIPQGVYEPHPMPLYDIRKDSTNGGFGSHRWGDPSTYEPSDNNAVMIYNIMRGIYYGDQWMCGGQNLAAHRLPASNWIAAANECDRAIDLSSGGTERQFRGGYEIAVADAEPLDVIDDLRDGCAGRIAEVGGIFKILVGGLPAAVYSFTDGDILVTKGQSYDPFPTLSATYNAIEATYPEPEEKWAMKDAPGLYNTDLEAADGNRRLPVGLKFPTTPFSTQVQRLMRAFIQEERRFRTHQFYLPPEAWDIEPNDVVSWSSQRNGYANKKFLVVRIEGEMDANQLVTLKEIDPSDYDWNVSFQLPTTISWTGRITPPIQQMTGWTVAPAAIQDAGGIDRRPAIKISCAPDLSDVVGVWVQVRLKETGDVVFDSDSNPYAAPFSWLISGQWTLPNTEYEARGKYLPGTDRATDWSAWLAVKTPNILVQTEDVLDGAIIASKIADAAVTAAKIMDEAVSNLKLADQAVSTAKLQVAAVTADVLASGAVISTKLADGAVTAAKLAQGAVDATSLASSIKAVEVVSSLPTTGNVEGRQVFLTTDGKLYRYHNGAWTAAVAAIDINGTLNSAQIADSAITIDKLAANAVDATKFASGIRPVEIVASLPTTGNVEGRTVYLTTDDKLYRYTGSAWTAATAAGDIAGQIVGTQISDGAISTPKLAAGSVTTNALAAGAVTADRIAANSITAGQIAAGAIGAQQIAAKAITVDKLLVGNFDNLIDNGFSQGNMASWIANGMQSYYLETGSSPLQGTWIVWCDARDQLLMRSPLLKVNPGESYNLSVWFYNTDPANDAFMGVYVKDQSGAAVLPNWLAVGPSNATKNAWTYLSANFTVPAGVYQVQPMFGVAKAAANGSNCVWGKPSMRRAASAELIVDGAVTATKIAAGSVSTDKLAVGSGKNLLQNAGFTMGLDCWGIIYTSGAIPGLSLALRPPGQSWSGANNPTLMLYQGSGPTGFYTDVQWRRPDGNGLPGSLSYAVPCAAGEWLELTAYISAHRCKVEMRIQWVRADGSVTGYSGPAVNDSTAGSSTNPDLWLRLRVTGAAPADAVAAALHLRKLDTNSGQTDSYMFVNKPMLCRIPAGATEATPWSDGGIVLITGGGIIANAVTADKIAANAVTAGKIATNAVTAGTIAANAVTAGTIAAGAVSAAQIAAGAITADKLGAGSVSTQALAVGTGGNYLTNSDLNAGLTNWAYEWSNEFASFRLTLRTDTYAPLPGAIEIYQGNGNQGVEYGVGQVDASGNFRYFPVKPGGWYELSVYYFGHRCTGVQPYLGVFDANDNLLAFPSWGIFPAAQNFDPQKNLANYQRFWGKTQMPANAAKVRVFFRMKGTIAGQNDSYLWLTRMYFGEANPNQSEATPWSDGSATLISGGNIVTNAITADKIAANAVTAGKIAANAVTAGTIAAGAVTAATIASGSITGDKIAANTIGAGQIAANAITAKQLVLTDFSNMADNGWQTGTLDGWTVQNQQAFYNDTGSNDAAGWVLQSLGRDCARSNFITVTPGEVYAFDVWVYNTDAGTANIYAALQTPTGTWAFSPIAATATKNGWVRLQGRYTVPSGYTKLAMLLQVEKTAGTGGSCYWSKPVMRRAVSAELIVDGAITANKIAVNSLDAITANLGAVNISSAVIGSLQVGTSNIAGGAVTAVSAGRNGAGQTIGAGGTVNLAACGITVAGDGRVVISAMTLGQFNQNGGSQNSQPIGCNIFRDGTAIFSQTYYLGVVQTVVSGTGGQNGGTSQTTYTAGLVAVPALYDAPGAGFHTYTLQIYCPGNTIVWNESNIIATAFKR